METMTPKERIDAVIKHQAVDRTPFTVVDGGAFTFASVNTSQRSLVTSRNSISFSSFFTSRFQE